MLEDEAAVRVKNKTDVKKQVRPVLVAGLGLSHDEHPPLAGQLAQLVGLGAGNINRAGAGELGVVNVQHLVVETLERPLRDGQQPDRDVEVRQPERGRGQAFDMLDVFLHIH